MSLVKNSESYARHMDELFERDRLEERDNSDLEYQEYCYLQGLQDKKREAAENSPLKPLFDAFAAAFQKDTNKPTQH